MSSDTDQNNLASVNGDANSSAVTRRAILGATAGAVAAAAATLAPTMAKAAEGDNDVNYKATGKRINQAVCLWCFQPKMDVSSLAKAAAAMGIKAIDLVEVKDWPILKQHGLVCSLSWSHMFVNGLNRIENHPECLEKLTKGIEDTGAAGWPNVITFSGMRKGLSDEEGIKNTVAGLKKVIGLAEKNKVNICLEMLNSRVPTEMKGHPDYQCDKLEWALEVCKQIGSPRMKILFDIYHVQIMQGDVITRIKELKDYIGHYHTAGVPGRNELDDSQELNYPPIMRAIAETGYTGYVAQEFIPNKPDQIASLRQAVRLCDV